MKTKDSLTSCLIVILMQCSSFRLNLKMYFAFFRLIRHFKKTTGIPSENIIGKRIEEVLPETYAHYLTRQLKEAISQNSVIKFEETIERTNGVFIFETSLTPIFNENKRCTHLIGSSRDIYKEKKTENYIRLQHDLSLFLSQTSVLEEALNQIIEAVTHIEEIDCGGVYLFNTADGTLNIAVHSGLSSEFISTTSHYASDSVNVQLIRNGKIISENFDAIQNHKNPYYLNEGIRSFIVIPILHKAQAIGALNLASHRFDQISNETRAILEAIASNIGGTIARIHSEEALKQSELNFSSLFDTMQDFLFILDENGNILKTNLTVKERLNYGEDELLGKSVLLVHPPDRRDEAGRIVGEMLEGKSEFCPVPLIAKDENQISVETRVIKGIWNNRNALFGISRDITERKKAEKELRESEQNYRGIFNATSEAIFIHDASSGEIIAVNNSMLAMFEYDSETDVSKLSISNLSINEPPYTLNEADQFFAKARLEGPQVFEWLAKKKNGKEFWVEISMRLITIGGQERIVVVARDISDRKRAEKIVRKEKERASLLLNLYTLTSVMSDGELYDHAIEIAVTLTDSKIGFFHQVCEDQEHLILTTWNKEAKKDCVTVFDNHYPLSIAGNWVECVRVRGPVVYNDFPSSPNQKGLPQGHSPLTRMMSIPVIEGGKIRLIFGVGNKPTDYKEHDVMQLQLVANELYKIIGKRKAENALKKSEELYRNLVERMPDGVYKSTHEGKFVEVNPAMVQILGYEDKDDLLSIDIKSTIYINPSDRDEINEMLHPEELGEYPLRKKDGSVIWVEDHGWFIYDDKGNIIFHEGILRDVTSRRKVQEELVESEQRFRSLYENTSIGLYRTTPDGQILLANPTLVNILKFDSFEEFAKINLENETNNFFNNRRQFLDQIERDGFVKGIESKWKRVDGVDIFVRESAKAFRDENGKTLYYEGTVEDITQRKHAELLLLKQANELKELNATKDKFLSIIAHDLRSPFNSTLGFSELLQDEAKFTEIATIERYASIISSTARNTLSLLDNLLAWSRMQQGKVQFNPVSVILGNLIKQEFSVLENSALQKNIRLVGGLTENIILVADENMLSTTLRNLFSNAIKFTPNNGKVTVMAKVEDGQVEISVSDTGIGMDTQAIQRLFNIETSFTTRGTQNEKGTGLGLLLCKEFIEKHGGKITVKSEPGVGSTFQFILPKNRDL